MKVFLRKKLLFLLFLSCMGLLSCKETRIKSKHLEPVGISKKVNSSISQLAINYKVQGSGKHALVFVHGWSCDASYWRKQLPYFSKNYKVVTLDLGGHGKSGDNRTDWSMDAFATDVLDVINTLEYDNLSIIGHSMGAVVVLNTIPKLSKTPQNVVFVDYFKRAPSKMALSPEIVSQMTRTIKTDFQNSTRAFVQQMFVASSDTALVRQISDHMASASPEVAIPAMESMMLNDLRSNFENLNTTRVNTAIINSSKEPIDPFYASIGIKSYTIAESGHFLMIEKPLAFNSLLEAVIKASKPTN